MSYDYEEMMFGHYEKFLSRFCGDPKMSDFKVGDVVRPKYEDHYGRKPRTVLRVERDEIGDKIIYRLPWGVEGWDRPISLELVSRPSEAKSPALKVGDRVRITKGGKMGECGVVDLVGATGIDVRINGRLFITYADHLEPLPPEPAREQCLMGDRCRDGGPGRCFHPPAGFHDTVPEPAIQWAKPYVYDPHPMTATEASIEPLVSYNIEAEKEILRIFGEAAFGAKSMISGAKPLPNQDGWMPAGTYMPLKEKPSLASQERMLAAKLIMRSTKKLLGITPADIEGGTGISATIPQRDRRFPSQTAQWGPYDIWDTLEDA